MHIFLVSFGLISLYKCIGQVNEIKSPHTQNLRHWIEIDGHLFSFSHHLIFSLSIYHLHPRAVVPPLSTACPTARGHARTASELREKHTTGRVRIRAGDSVRLSKDNEVLGRLGIEKHEKGIETVVKAEDTLGATHAVDGAQYAQDLHQGFKSQFPRKPVPSQTGSGSGWSSTSQIQNFWNLYFKNWKSGKNL